MALINCPECGKEISDKATYCPNCGNPINQQPQQAEEYLCCPKCGSRELHAEHKGFSGGKALTGALLVGGIGLLAGTIGSKDTQITCLKCANKFKAGEAKVVKPNTTNYKADRTNTITTKEQSTPYMCECGKWFFSEKEHVYCPKCGRLMSKNNTELYYKNSTKIWERSRNGCLGQILLCIVLIAIIIILCCI